MLTLDETTLYYFFLSDPASDGKKSFSTGVNKWAASIPSGAKPASKATTISKSGTGKASSSTRSGSIIPPLTDASTRSSNNSVLTRNIVINQVVPKLEPAENSILIVDGGLSDEDETIGHEREAAVKSPIKGKVRVTSSVSSPIVMANVRVSLTQH
jgi:hypothetical protein